MPIIIKDCEWTETDELLFITIKVPMLNKTKMDIYCNDCYIKINNDPYVFELDLLKEIDSQSSLTNASMGDCQVKFTLKKKETEIWGTIKYESTSFNQRYERRNNSIQQAHTQFKDSKLQKKNLNADHQRYLVQKQLDMEQKQRKELEDVKLIDKQLAQVSINEWNTGDNSITSSIACSAEVVDKTPSTLKIHTDSAIGGIDDEIFGQNEPTTTQTENLDQQNSEKNQIHTNDKESDRIKKQIVLDMDDDCEDGLDMAEILSKVHQQMKRKTHSQCAPRKSSTIYIHFTNRGPLPTSVARESEDVKWNARINEMKAMEKQTLILDSSDTSVSLKAKGDSFYKKQNYLSAINAYSESLRLDPSTISCLSNRSACHWNLGNLQLCIDDCDYALSLIDNLNQLEKEANEGILRESHFTNTMTSKLHFRKGSALLKQNHSKSRKKALGEYQSALALDSKNELIRVEVDKLLEFE